MNSRPPHHTMRVPPQVDGGSGVIARELREQPPALDEVRRARMERSLAQAWRMHGAARVPLSRLRMQRPSARVLWVASIGSAAAGGLLALSLLGDSAPTASRMGVGHFELRIDDAAVQSGAVSEGQVLETGEHGRIEVDLQIARLQLSRGTRVRFDRLSEPELRLSLLKGRLDVDFHPSRKGEQHLAIETGASRVQVVGTRFVLDVDALGNTEVQVSEGVVELLPRSGAPARRVAAGEHAYLRADDGDESERSVRAAIEQKLRTLEGATAEPVPFQPDMDLSQMVDLEPSASGQRPSRAITRKLEAARRLLRQGRHADARARLRGLAESGIAVRFRVEALTLIAESYTAQGDVLHAAKAYRRAAELSPGDPAGHNARFALARLLERYAHDEVAAAAAYKHYLARAPRGALAVQARQALCRLDQSEFCKDR